jgi:hypothetical protein
MASLSDQGTTARVRDIDSQSRTLSMSRLDLDDPSQQPDALIDADQSEAAPLPHLYFVEPLAVVANR